MNRGAVWLVTATLAMGGVVAGCGVLTQAATATTSDAAAMRPAFEGWRMAREAER